MEGLTRLGRGGMNAPTDVVVATAGGTSGGFVALMPSVALALVEAAGLAFVAAALPAVALVVLVVALVALVPFVAFVALPTVVVVVALMALGRVVVVGLVAVLVTARLGFTGGLAAEGRRRAGVTFAATFVVRLAGAHLA